MLDYSQIFENNRRWAADRKASDQDFFSKLSGDQFPGYLYIGCSDSRVPPEEITGAQMGEMLVHRNVGNQVDPSDPNTVSAIQFAVEDLGVKHIVVCGHTKCGGIIAAMENKTDGMLARWVSPIRKLAVEHRDKLDHITDMDERFRRLVELNVETQCRNILALQVVQMAIAKSNSPTIHAWVYDLHTGDLKDLEFRY
jgi:carbonic anhydrase